MIGKRVRNTIKQKSRTLITDMLSVLNSARIYTTLDANKHQSLTAINELTDDKNEAEPSQDDEDKISAKKAEIDKQLENLPYI